MRKALLGGLLMAMCSGPVWAQADSDEYRPPEPPPSGPAPRAPLPPLLSGRESVWMFREGLRLHRDGYVERAIPIYRAALDKDPGRLEFRPYLALALDQSGRPDLALEQYDQYLRLEPNDTTVRLNRVVARLHLGDLDGASQELEGLALSSSADASYQNLVGLVALKKHKYPAAEAAFKQALAFDSQRADTHINLALTHLADGHVDEAKGELELALHTKQPPKAVIETDLGVLLADHKQLPDALKLFEGAWVPKTLEGTNFQQSVPQALLNLASGLAREDRVDEAIVVAAKLVDATPDRPDASVLYARLLGRMGRYPEARKEIDRALAFGPRAHGADWPYALEVSGIINLGLGDNNAARVDLEQVVIAQPESVSARHNLAIALGRLGRLEDAIAQEIAAAEIEAANAAVWYNLGILYDLNDQPKPALEAFQKFLSLSPKDPAAPSLKEHMEELEDMVHGRVPRKPQEPPPPPAKDSPTKPSPTTL